MQSVAQTTRHALHRHAFYVAGLTLVGTGLTLFLWVRGAFAHANPGGGWGSDALIATALIGLAFSTSCLVITDFTHHLLPHVIVVPAAGFTLVLMFFAWVAGADGRAALWAVGIGLAVGIVLFALALAPGSGLGGGDVKLAALLAMVVGWLNPGALFLALMCSLLSATVFAIIRIGFKKGTMKSPIPLGPFLILGAWIALCLRAIW